MPEPQRVSDSAKQLNYKPTAISKIITEYRQKMISTEEFTLFDRDQIKDLTTKFLTQHGQELWPKDRKPEWPTDRALITEAVFDIFQVQRRNQVDIARKKRHETRRSTVDASDGDSNVSDSDFTPDPFPDNSAPKRTRPDSHVETTRSGRATNNSRQAVIIEDENTTSHAAQTTPTTTGADANAGMKRRHPDINTTEEAGNMGSNKRHATGASSIPAAGAHSFRNVDAAASEDRQADNVTAFESEVHRRQLPPDQSVQAAGPTDQPHTTESVEPPVQLQTPLLHSVTQVTLGPFLCIAFNKTYEVDRARLEDLASALQLGVARLDEARQRAFKRTWRQDLSPKEHIEAEEEFAKLQEARSGVEKAIIEIAGGRFVYD